MSEPKFRVRARPGGAPPEDISAWCEVCGAEFHGGGRYGPSTKARGHTARTGHLTTADRSGRSVWFEAEP